MSDSSSTDDTSGASGTDESRGTNWLEWTAFALGVLITVSVIGYLGVQIVTGSDEPAALRVTLQAPEEPSAEISGATVLIPIEVENKGGRVAEEAVIEVCAGSESCGTVSFAYIPKGSKRTGKIGLSAPLAGPLKPRVVSYRTM